MLIVGVVYFQSPGSSGIRTRDLWNKILATYLLISNSFPIQGSATNVIQKGFIGL